MEKNELYPEGWTFRKFFAPRNHGTGGGPNKKPRPDDSIVDEILQDQNQQHQQVGQQVQEVSGQPRPQANGGGLDPQ